VSHDPAMRGAMAEDSRAISGSDTNWAGAGVAATSLALLVYQVSLTRIFSVLVFNHLVFFALSTAMFGLAAAGVTVYALKGRGRISMRSLPGVSSILGLSFVVVLPAVLRAGGRLGAAQFPSAEGVRLLVLCFAFCAIPFYLGGICLSLSLLEWAERAGKVYGFDLAGAAAGCVFSVVLLGLLPAPAVVLAAGIPACAAAFAFRRAAGAGRAGLLNLCAPVFVLAAVLDVPSTGLFQVRYAKGKPQSNLYERWNAFSFVRVFKSSSFAGWSMPSNRIAGEQPAYLGMDIDAHAFTPVMASRGIPGNHMELLDDLTSAAYQVAQPQSVLVIGSGGGRDVLAALAGGAARVTAVEINPAIVNLMRNELAGFTGNLYNRPDVSVVCADGRSFLHQSRERFDVIQISMVDTFTASPAGAFALTENSLYTVECIEEAILKLSPDGLLTVTWADFPEMRGGTRVASIAWQALKNLQCPGGPSHMFVMSGKYLGNPRADNLNVIVSRSPLTPARLKSLERFAESKGFEVLYPGRGEGVISQMINSSPQGDFEKHFPLDITPTTDDRPFIYFQYRLSDGLMGGSIRDLPPAVSMLFSFIGIIALACAAFIIAPLVIARPEVRRMPLGSAIAGLPCFACLGFGFMLVEVCAVQRLTIFLGYPTYALSLVLFTLLLSCAGGSTLSDRIVSAVGLKPVFAAAAALMAFEGILMKFILSYMMAFALPARLAISVILLAPLGCALGTFFPTLIRRAKATREDSFIPRAYAVNGTFSVLGGVCAVLFTAGLGFMVTLFIASGVYLLALALSNSEGLGDVRKNKA